MVENGGIYNDTDKIKPTENNQWAFSRMHYYKKNCTIKVQQKI